MNTLNPPRPGFGDAAPAAFFSAAVHLAVVVWIFLSHTGPHAPAVSPAAVMVSLISLSPGHDALAPVPSKPAPRKVFSATPPEPVALPAETEAPATESAAVPASAEAPAAISPAERPAEPAAAESGAAAPWFTPDYLSNPPPSYPTVSRRLGEQGKVLVRALVGADGHAREVLLHAGSGFPRLDRAALEAVRNWRFVPARQGLSTTNAWVVVPIVFSLEG